MGIAEIVSGSNTFRVYYEQRYQKGQQASTLSITKITAKRNGYADPGTFYADGRLMVDGTAVLSCSIAAGNGDFGLYPANQEQRIGRLSGSKTIQQPLGKEKVVSISLAKNTYESWLNYNTNESFTMPGRNINIELSAIPQYKVSFESGQGYEIVPTRIGSVVGADIGELSSEDDIFIGDTISIHVRTSGGYAVESVTINGEEYVPGTEIVVDGDMSISASAKMQGAAYIGNELYLPFIHDGNGWKQYIPEAGNGTGWDILT